MAESQLTCMEDGCVRAPVPESRPEFYYSEEQRAAVEELLRTGDGAFKTRLRENDMKDFLSAREVKVLLGSFRRYDAGREGEGEAQGGTGTGTGTGSPDSGVHSTYWPQMSDTEVPPLDLGWPSGAMFKGVTRVAVHTHPPKDNGPHVKEVVRRLIQEAGKCIAIVMDLLTDLHVLQDLMDAAGRRSVPVYILLDNQGVPHFLDMCSRLQIGSQHLRNIRTRTLQGVGFSLSFGRLPGSLCNKYMLIDGDKVMFGSYSFCWSTSRMDRNMITVMTGQVVDTFDQDFRELYAVSEPLDLYKEFHVSPPAARGAAGTLRSTRPPLPATTSRFQVTLGDSRKDKIQVPAHKFYNPKYALVFGDIPRPSGSLQEPGVKRASVLSKFPEELEAEKQLVTSSERIERPSPLPAEAPSDIFQNSRGASQGKKAKWTWRKKLFKKSTSKLSVDSFSDSPCPSPTGTDRPEEDGEDPSVDRKPSKRKGKSNPAVDSQSVGSHHRTKGKCKVS